jgi:hypothetical protein
MWASRSSHRSVTVNFGRRFHRASRAHSSMDLRIQMRRLGFWMPTRTRSAAGLAERQSCHRGNRWITWRCVVIGGRLALQAVLSAVRAGSVPQRSRPGIIGHERSPNDSEKRQVMTRPAHAGG